MCVPLPPDPSNRRNRPLTLRSSPALVVGGAILLLVAAVMLSQGIMASRSDSQSPKSPPAAGVEPTTRPGSATPGQQRTPTPAARLALESRPTGATVVVDGRERGTTPIVVDDLTPGSYLIKLSLQGRGEWQGNVALAPDESKQLTVALEPIPGPTPTPSPVPRDPVYPLAVMVENSFNARPQSGLARADIVYEALVEGGITRFMAIYVDGQSDTIGPVRSARHYFAHLAGEYNASYIFIGSSPQGYEALSAIKIPRLDETWGDPGFWRSRARYAPHNAYTSTDLIRSSLDRVRNVSPGSTAGFQFRQDSTPVQGAEAREVSLVYPGGYRVRYVYSPEERLYHRHMEGLPHRDADTGEQVAPSNLVVQWVKAWGIPGDDAGRLDMEQVGKGEALFFRNGVVTEGYWQKPSLGNHTEWYDSQWKPVEMNPGKIWIQMIPPTGKVSY